MVYKNPKRIGHAPRKQKTDSHVISNFSTSMVYKNPKRIGHTPRKQIQTWHRLDVSHTRPAYRVLSRMSFLFFDQHGWHRPKGSVIVSISRIMRHQHSCSVIHKLSAWVRTEIYTLQSCLVFGSRKIKHFAECQLPQRRRSPNFMSHLDEILSSHW